LNVDLLGRMHIDLFPGAQQNAPVAGQQDALPLYDLVVFARCLFARCVEVCLGAGLIGNMLRRIDVGLDRCQDACAVSGLGICRLFQIRVSAQPQHRAQTLIIGDRRIGAKVCRNIKIGVGVLVMGPGALWFDVFLLGRADDFADPGDFICRQAHGCLPFLKKNLESAVAVDPIVHEPGNNVLFHKAEIIAFAPGSLQSVPTFGLGLCVADSSAVPRGGGRHR
jgi:hypothetical protein